VLEKLPYKDRFTLTPMSVLDTCHCANAFERCLVTYTFATTFMIVRRSRSNFLHNLQRRISSESNNIKGMEQRKQNHLRILAALTSYVPKGADFVH